MHKGPNSYAAQPSGDDIAYPVTYRDKEEFQGFSQKDRLMLARPSREDSSAHAACPRDGWTRLMFFLFIFISIIKKKYQLFLD
jgi:hypothetical protein